MINGRKTEVKLIEQSEPLNLRILAEQIARKITKGEIYHDRKTF